MSAPGLSQQVTFFPERPRLTEWSTAFSSHSPRGLPSGVLAGATSSPQSARPSGSLVPASRRLSRTGATLSASPVRDETVGSVTDAELPDGISPDAAKQWPSRELIDSYLGGHHELFSWRPGEVVEIDGEAAQAAARQYRDVLGQYASGVTVITTVQGGKPIGMTCRSTRRAALARPAAGCLPPQKTSRAFAAIRQTRKFCVNILAADQTEISNAFASRAEDKFEGVEWDLTATGTPDSRARSAGSTAPSRTCTKPATTT